MRAFKIVFLLFIMLLVFGSAGFFGYELFIKPTRLEKQEKAKEAAAPLPSATPDQGIPEFQKLKALFDAGNFAEARDGLDLWIKNHPQSPLLSEAIQKIGSANMALLFQPGSTNGVSYTVVKGDSLARIASKHQSNAELIQKANALPGINLQIGQVLLIPDLKPSLELDREAKTLTLLNNGVLLKQYTLLSAPSSSKRENLNSKVLEKVATVSNKRVAFGDKTYAQSERSILLVQAPPLVSAPPVTNSTNSPAAGATNASTVPPAPLPGGFVLSPADLQEIFPLVSRNTPVLIH